MSNLKNKCAFFIDAENQSPSVISEIFDYISNHNLICVSAQAFGDFSNNSLCVSYKKHLNKYAVTAQQCFNITKNSSDFALAIWTMDFFYENQDVDTYILASSDIDFIPLINRLRRARKYVIVFGSENANHFTKEAASIFITRKENIGIEPCQKTEKNLLINTIQKAFNSNMKINLADLGNVLSQNLGSSYIYAKKGKKLSELINSLGKFQVITDEKGTSVVYQT